MEVIMSQNIMYALEIMGKGMGSIFAVILLLTLIVMLMSKFAEIKNRNSSQDEA
jgi:Na+-transporting methylmalonyl-CoA/oxaloacetate decarboxylase gamma subunit